MEPRLRPVDIEPGTRAGSLYRTAKATETLLLQLRAEPVLRGTPGRCRRGRQWSRTGRGGTDHRTHRAPILRGLTVRSASPVVDGGPHPIYAGLAEAVRERRQR